MSVLSTNKAAKELFVYVFLIFVLLLTSINISEFLKSKTIKVLGTETENKEGSFWKEFLTSHPDYVPGLIESGRQEEANKIDPNYSKP